MVVSAEGWRIASLKCGAEFDLTGATRYDGREVDLVARAEVALLSQPSSKFVVTTRRADVSLLKDACLDLLVVFLGDEAFVFAATKMALAVPALLPMLLWIAEGLPLLLFPSAGLNFIERAKARASANFWSIGGGGGGMFSDASKKGRRPRPRSERDLENLWIVSHINKKDEPRITYPI